jgi:methanogenic corrinoid protein MtbC1
MENTETEAAAAIAAQRKSLSEMIVARQYDLQPEIWIRYGKEGREKSIRDVEYHLSYLIESIYSNDLSIFLHYVEWLKILFEGLKFPATVLPVMLNSMKDVLGEQLPKEMASFVEEYIGAATIRLQKSPSLQPSFIDVADKTGSLAKKYLDAILSADKPKASRLIMDAHQSGINVKNIYLRVLQPAQQEIGRLWHLNKVSVAQEHYASAATQLIMSQLYSQIFSTKKIGRRLVAACVSEELHEIGIRMVADFFEMSGWDTYYLGANLPVTTITRALKDYRADILALSCTIPVHQSKLKNMIAHVRSSQSHRDVKIIVGGYSLNVFRDAWKPSGADGYAPDAEEAVRLAHRLIDDNSTKR